MVRLSSYQVTSLFEGVITRGTGKILRKLKLNLAGKTGTTNENTDAWFIGFTSNLVIGVYVGMDNPKPLGKFETGSKTALSKPILNLKIALLVFSKHSSFALSLEEIKHNVCRSRL